MKPCLIDCMTTSWQFSRHNRSYYLQQLLKINCTVQFCLCGLCLTNTIGELHDCTWPFYTTGWGSTVYKVHESTLTWCARHIKSKSWRLRNFVTISDPKVKDTPLSLSPQPWMSLSGSDHNRSHRRPVSGTSVGRAIDRIWSKSWRSGDKPVSQ